MSVRYNTNYVCDGCGAESTSRDTMKPEGWAEVNIYNRMSIKNPEAHACSRPCLAKVLRDLADKIDPPSEVMLASGGPYR